LAARVRAELKDGEVVVWVGQPRPDLYAKMAGCAVPFGIGCTAVSALWVLVTFGIGVFFVVAGDAWVGLAGVPFFAAGLFALPFLLIGAVFLTFPVWNRKWAKKVCYVLTDRRALTWEPVPFGGTTVRSYNRGGLGRVARYENPDGSGSLVFQEVTVSGTDGPTTRRYGFIHIDNVRSVEDLVRRTLLGG
jgi:hypothetical protein